MPLILSKNQMFRFLTVASLASMQYPKDTVFDKGKLSVMFFINNLLVTEDRSISKS